MTRFLTGDFNFTFGAENGFVEIEDDALLEVVASLGPVFPASRGVAEEGIEDVSEATEHVETLEWAVVSAIGANHGTTEAIVLGSLLGI